MVEKIGEQENERLPKRAMRWIVTGVAGSGGIAISLVQSNVQEWVKANNQDQYLVKYAGPVMHRLAEIVQSPFFLAVTSALIGGALVLWLDYALPQRTKRMGIGLLIFAGLIAGLGIWVLLNPIQQTVAAGPAIPTPPAAAPEYISNAAIEGPFSLTAASNRVAVLKGVIVNTIARGQRLRVFVEIANSSSGRIDLGSLRQEVKGEQVDFAIISVFVGSNNATAHWGDVVNDEPAAVSKRVDSQGMLRTQRIRVFIIGPDAQEQVVAFSIVNLGTQDKKMQYPVVLPEAELKRAVQ